MPRITEEQKQYIQKNFKIPVDYFSPEKSWIVSLCDECKPSKNWLGLFSPKEKIRKSGLWLVNELWKTPLSDEDMKELKQMLGIKN